jgi:uncharacterized protein YlaI
MIHTGDRPYKCDWPNCEWAFKEKHTLQIHQLKHTGIKQYVCEWPDCGQRFQSKQGRRLHTGRAHPIVTAQ